MDDKENPLKRDHSLTVVLPGGQEKTTIVHGSKPVMDLLVSLCASYHLNPSEYTVEVLSLNKNVITFKPNSPVGSLEAEKIVLKPKVMEEKTTKPYMPEATVRLLINYNKSHRTVVRVNPKLPLRMLLPVVCDKCEFKEGTTVLLRDSQDTEPLDLSKTLNELGLREVFAKDMEAQHQPAQHEAAVTWTETIATCPLQGVAQAKASTGSDQTLPLPVTDQSSAQCVTLSKKKQRENRGFLSFFRKKANPEMGEPLSVPVSPGLIKQATLNVQTVSLPSTLPAEVPKKRRAPRPPMGASQSVPTNLSTCDPKAAQSSTLRSMKRRAPPPPCADGHQQLHADVRLKGL
ncbi:cordon-bleu protein-like 1 [Thalassophryne amazonica]|uniref:cordon-bleu protein-like 1 n=1 Tax=Thalassophryne amazonica TaxID=390379 RepID=UPI0014712EE9|nr:cordon-bleu protein-like 1 [Thalassophryne amazonica]